MRVPVQRIDAESLALSIFEGRPFGSNTRISEELSVAGWHASTSSRSAESVDRECGIAWVRVERRGSEANVNSHRASSKGSTITTKETIGTRYNQLEMGRRT